MYINSFFFRLNSEIQISMIETVDDSCVDVIEEDGDKDAGKGWFYVC
jgi:hypothetical protein